MIIIHTSNYWAYKRTCKIPYRHSRCILFVCLLPQNLINEEFPQEMKLRLQLFLMSYFVEMQFHEAIKINQYSIMFLPYMIWWVWVKFSQSLQNALEKEVVHYWKLKERTFIVQFSPQILFSSCFVAKEENYRVCFGSQSKGNTVGS